MADDFKPMNLAQLYQGADAAVAQAMQTNLMVMQASHLKKEYDEEDQLRNLAMNSTSVNPDTGAKSFDLKAFTQGAYGVNPMKAIGFEKTQRETEKANLEIKKTEGEIVKNQADIDEKRMKTAADRLKHMNETSAVPYQKWKELTEAGMPDAQARAQVQPMYDQARQAMLSSGMFKPEDIKGMAIMQKPEFDPAVAEGAARQVLGFKDQLAQYWEEKKFGQGERHHQENMQVQIRGQNVTIRGQDLTDARAKESLAQQGLEVKENDDGTYNIIDKKAGTSSDVLDKNGQPLKGKSSLTESQGKAVGFGQRAVEAHNLILQLEHGGEMGKFVSVKQGAGNVPLVGGMLEGAINSTLPGGMQKYEQAQRDFVNAVLRPESGATITPQEFDNAKKQYFPQVGDTPAVIKQKQESREREIEALKAMAGPGAKKFPEIRRPQGAEKAGSTSASVTAPDGKTYTFPNQAAADEFKKKAGIP